MLIHRSYTIADNRHHHLSMRVICFPSHFNIASQYKQAACKTYRPLLCAHSPLMHHCGHRHHHLSAHACDWLSQPFQHHSQYKQAACKVYRPLMMMMVRLHRTIPHPLTLELGKRIRHYIVDRRSFAFALIAATALATLTSACIAVGLASLAACFNVIV